jgi:hypothetical protein
VWKLYKEKNVCKSCVTTLTITCEDGFIQEPNLCNGNLVSSYLIFITYNKVQGHDGRFSIYVHASREKPVHVSRYFVGREIHSEPVCMAHKIFLGMP